jgi:transglutaminase-like putative cysteine protease
MHFKITHTTTYSYSEPASICHNEVHLVPRETPRQRCPNHRLIVRPTPATQRQLTDWFGNKATLFSIQQEHRKLIVTATSHVQIQPTAWPDLESTPAWEEVCAGLETDRSPAGLDILQYVYESPLIRETPELADYARESFPPGRPLLAAVADLNRRVHTDFVYDPVATTVSTPLEEVLQVRKGVCQDFAHLQVGCLRSLGLPARYVSGYIRTHPPPGKPRLVGADASHACAAVHCPGLGWVDFDPTNNSMPSAEHITLAWGRDYGDICPVKGVVLGGGQHGLTVSVDVEPLAA